MCELYKDQLITIRYAGNIYYGNMKIMYQTFYDKIIEVLSGNEWVPAKIIGEESVKEIYRINDDLLCSEDLMIHTQSFNKITCNIEYGTSDKVSKSFDILGHSKTKVSNLMIGVKFIPNTFLNEKMTCYSSESDAYIYKIEKTDIVSDWLFGIEFIDDKYEFYALTNGMIICVK